VVKQEFKRRLLKECSQLGNAYPCALSSSNGRPDNAGSLEGEEKPIAWENQGAEARAE
jgi:hypothetical protein